MTGRTIRDRFALIWGKLLAEISTFSKIIAKTRSVFDFTFWAGLAIVIAMLSLRVVDPGLLQIIRFQSFDMYQRIKPREFTDLPVRIIDVDEASLAKYGQWPWPRTVIADLINNLAAKGAIVIGFDIVFAEPDRLSPPRIAQENPNLPQSVREALRALPHTEVAMREAMSKTLVVLGQTSVRYRSDSGLRNRQLATVPFAAIGGDPEPFLEKYPDLVQNVPELEEVAAGRGVFSLVPDLDGVYRRLPVVMKVQDKMRLALSVEIIRVATGGRAFATKVDGAGLSGIIVGGNLVKTDGNGRVWPYFTEPNPVRYISAAKILDGTADPKLIANHMIVVGTSAVGLEDLRATPLVAGLPGVEIHAQVIESILSNSMLIRPNYILGMELFFLAIAGLAIILLVPRLGAVWALVFALTLLGGYTGLSFYAFSQWRILIDPTFPVGSIIALFIMMATANYMREERQRQQIRGAFGQYLSPDLVDQIIEDPERLVLGGETRELSVLFTDIRGFTTLSEAYKNDPQGLTRLMNRFLTVLSNAILDRGGTIDKYMGDAVMAFWNAPLDTKNHAEQSCRAALDMIKALEELNKKRIAEHLEKGENVDPIKVGIGVNTGDCVVGNMGSDMRFDYTALADTVNIASRLEGQSKPFGIAVVIGNNTAKEISDKLAVIEIDYIRVKGKLEPERMFGLLGDEELAGDEKFKAIEKHNNSMITSYRQQEWEWALDAVGKLAKASEKAGIDLSVYLDLYTWRIEEFMDNPPGVQWDGVYTATSK